MTARQIPSQDYYDNGCRVYPRCLECPLPHCVLTLSEDSPSMTVSELRKQFGLMHTFGLTVRSISSYADVPEKRVESLLA